MATQLTRKRVRYTLDVHFVNQEEKEVFLQRLKNVRQLLTPAGSPPLDNFSLLNRLCDSVEINSGSQSYHQTSDTTSTGPTVKSFMSNSGKHCTVILGKRMMVQQWYLYLFRYIQKWTIPISWWAVLFCNWKALLLKFSDRAFNTLSVWCDKKSLGTWIYCTGIWQSY